MVIGPNSVIVMARLRELSPPGHEAAVGGGPPGGGECKPVVPPSMEWVSRWGWVGLG